MLVLLVVLEGLQCEGRGRWCGLNNDGRTFGEMTGRGGGGGMGKLHEN